MKLISKYKDYYDYLQGIYGIDEIMVYDRRTDNLIRRRDIVLSDSANLNVFQLAIANRLWTIYEYKEVVYHTEEELVTLHNLLISDGNDKATFLFYGKWFSGAKSIEAAAKKHYTEHNCETSVNTALRQPVLIKVSNGDFTHTEPYTKYSNYYKSTFVDTSKKESSSWGIPLLSDFGLPTYYPADIAYQDISAFIAWTKDNPEIPNKQNDIEKLKSHGFDDKVSFRHRQNH